MIMDATQQLAAMANEAGIPGLSEDGLPRVKIHPQLSITAMRLGEIVPRLDLFNRNGDLVYFDAATKEMEKMNPILFRTWIQPHVFLYEKTYDSGDSPPVTLAVQTADTILQSIPFRQGVRNLAGVNQVRCPVLRDDGTLELLPWGYDAQTEIFTIPGGLEYAQNLGIEAAKGRIYRMLHQFPITDDRSMAVQVAALLALYIRHLPQGMSLRPGFIWYANKQGSGKSVLAKAALYPVMGSAAAAKLKKNEDLDKEVEAFLRARVAYIFLDNVRGGLNSTTLEQMITSKKSTGRGLGSHSIFTTDNTALLLVSANQVEFNDDMRRRFLLIDLFEEGNP
jgi:hypothetical protein